MAEFLSELDMRYLGNGTWVLRGSLIYQSDLLPDVIIAPENFITDLASVPRLPIVFMLTGGAATKEAVIHDFLYRTKHCSRKQADAIFHEAMTLNGESWWRRKLMWAGVRLFGWTAYPKNSPAEG